MAAGKSYLARPTYLFVGGEMENSMIRSESAFEFNEADIWNTNQTVASSPEFKKMMLRSSRVSKKSTKMVDNGGDYHRPAGTATVSSLPVNIPDWSKILKEDYRDCRRRGINGDFDYDDDDEDSEEGMIPPHEFVARQLARNGVSSFSVHEGLGRTLKGRDLRRVRNAIWEKTGFQD